MAIPCPTFKKKSDIMKAKNEKNYGIWMDTRSAVIAGVGNEGTFSVLGQIDNPGAEGNSNENAANNHEMALTQKFFKEIAALMTNPERVHITGTGQIQEQFASYLAGSAQYKNVETSHSTSNKMGNEALLSYFEVFFN